MRYAYLVTFFLVVLTVGVLGFRGCTTTRPPLEVFPDMDRQPKYMPQGESKFFADGRADRPLPAGVIARGSLRADTALYQGKDARNELVRGIPASLTVDATFLGRGRDRYMIYCAPCHGSLGDGNGITKSYGMGATPTFHDERLRTVPEGHLYDVITNGKGNMLPYADKLEPQDRWAVVAYVRALQRSQHGTVADVPPSHRAELGIK